MREAIRFGVARGLFSNEAGRGGSAGRRRTPGAGESESESFLNFLKIKKSRIFLNISFNFAGKSKLCCKMQKNPAGISAGMTILRKRVYNARRMGYSKRNKRLQSHGSDKGVGDPALAGSPALFAFLPGCPAIMEQRRNRV